MAMSKFWKETWDRLDAIESALGDLGDAEIEAAVEGRLEERLAELGTTAVTKEELMKIKGVGSALADEILELLNS